MKLDKIQYKLKTAKYDAGVTLLTPTGDRPICMKRAEYYFARQTYHGPIQWIIADDGKEAFQSSFPTEGRSSVQIVHQKNKPFGQKARSITGNLLSTLEWIKYDKIMIFEDDDWYHPEYIQIMIHRLNVYGLAGEGNAKYYNIKNRTYKICGNTKSASLCQTVFKSSLLPHFYTSLLKRESAFIDSRFWDKDVSKFCFQDRNYCVGIKGMPGRLGIGMGHRPSKSMKSDKDFKILRQWIPPEDVGFYESLY